MTKLLVDVLFKWIDDIIWGGITAFPHAMVTRHWSLTTAKAPERALCLAEIDGPVTDSAPYLFSCSLIHRCTYSSAKLVLLRTRRRGETGMARTPRRMKIFSTCFVLFAVTLLVSVGYAQDLGGVPPFGDQERGASTLALQGLLGRAAEVKERHADRLMANPDVVGAGVGVTQDGKPGVIILTKRAGVQGVPTELEGVPVEVVVTGEIFAIPVHAEEPSPSVGAKGKARIDRTQSFGRPVPIGVSTGNAHECSAGTIGARVVDSSGLVYALSNNHVYALENTAGPNDEILQPGLYDTQCVYNPDNFLGTLGNFVDITFSTSADNKIDAAIAVSSTNNLGNATPSDGYGTPSANTEVAAVGLAVMKYGRTSGQTKGSIYLINGTILVGYPSGTARFTQQIGVLGSRGAFIKAGDSGSLLVTSSEIKPVGLLFAGDNSGKYAFANPIGLVLNAFGVSIDGSTP